MNKKKPSRLRYVVLAAMIAISAICILAVVNEVNSTFALQKEIDGAKEVKQQLIEEKASLEKQQNNLNDPNYIIRYARGKHMVTKEDGEQVFKLPETEK